MSFFHVFAPFKKEKLLFYNCSFCLCAQFKTWKAHTGFIQNSIALEIWIQNNQNASSQIKNVFFQFYFLSFYFSNHCSDGVNLPSTHSQQLPGHSGSPPAITASIISSPLKTTNCTVQNKSFVLNPAGFTEDWDGDASNQLWFLSFRSTHVFWLRANSINPPLVACVNWLLFNIPISHLPHSSRHARVKEIDKSKSTWAR